MTEPHEIDQLRSKYAHYRDPQVRADIEMLCDALEANRAVPNPAEWSAMVSWRKDCEERMHKIRMLLTVKGPHVVEELLTQLYELTKPDGEAPDFTQFSSPEGTEGEDS